MGGRARRTMTGAYLVLFALMVVELLLQSLGTAASDTTLMQAITLSVAATQAFLFTFAPLALLETRWPGWKYLAREAACVALLVAAILSVYVLCSAEIFANAYYAFAAVYYEARITLMATGKYSFSGYNTSSVQDLKPVDAASISFTAIGNAAEYISVTIRYPATAADEGGSGGSGGDDYTGGGGIEW